MRQPNIAFPNLRAEMARDDLNLVDVAARCGINRDTLARKLSGKTPISLDEAVKIQETFFPDQDIRYLFASEKEDVV